MKLIAILTLFQTAQSYTNDPWWPNYSTVERLGALKGNVSILFEEHFAYRSTKLERHFEDVIGDMRKIYANCASTLPTTLPTTLQTTLQTTLPTTLPNGRRRRSLGKTIPFLKREPNFFRLCPIIEK